MVKLPIVSELNDQPVNSLHEQNSSRMSCDMFVADRKRFAMDITSPS